MSGTRECHVCSSTHPRLATHASAGRVVDDGEDGRVAARKLDVLLVDVRWMVLRHPLLVEEVVVDPVREALHVEETPAQVRQGARRDIDVVLDEVDLLQPALGEEDLVRVGDVDLVPPDLQLHGSSIENHPSGACLEPRESENEVAGSPLMPGNSCGARPTNCGSTRFEAGVSLSGRSGRAAILCRSGEVAEWLKAAPC